MLRVRLAEEGRRANVNDLWIAASAIAESFNIVTHDADYDAIESIGGPARALATLKLNADPTCRRDLSGPGAGPDFHMFFGSGSVCAGQGVAVGGFGALGGRVIS